MNTWPTRRGACRSTQAVFGPNLANNLFASSCNNRRLINVTSAQALAMWPAPGLDDTQLSKSGLPLELHRAQITDRRVSAFRVVEALDIVKHVCLCFIARPVRFIAG